MSPYLRVPVGTGLLAAVLATGVVVATTCGGAGMPIASGLAAALPVAVLLLTRGAQRPPSWHPAPSRL